MTQTGFSSGAGRCTVAARMIRLTVRRALAATALLALPSCATQQSDPPTRADAAPADNATQPDASADAVADVADDQALADDVAQPDAPKPDVPTSIDAPPTDVGGCMTGLTECGGSCRDTMTDPMHCGACGQLCVGGQTCAGGRCACPTGRALCGATCVDTGADPNNCGACGTRCPMGQACSTGACMLTCAAGTMLCAGACRDVMTDPMHCGMCNRACFTGQSCVGGTCVCPTGQIDCGGTLQEVTVGSSQNRSGGSSGRFGPSA